MRALAIAPLLFVTAMLLPSEPARSSNPVAPDILFTVAARYEPLAWMKGGERFPSGASVYIRDTGGRRQLAPNFFASADPVVSFDTKTALVTAKLAAHDVWQIWEVPLAGGDPRRVTNCAGDCVRPFFLPDGRLIYAEKVEGQFVIRVADLTGGQSLSLTYGAASSIPTDVLRDGRILFETATLSGPELYTVYSDGSGVESYRCDHGHPRHAGKQVGSGDIVFADGTHLARFTSSLAKQVPVTTPAGEYLGEVAETGSADWLLPWRPNAQSRFRVMRWKPGEAGFRPAIEIQGTHAVQPVLIAERPVPNRHPSGLHDWPTANLLCLNAYTSKYKFADGSVHSVRLYTQESGTTRVLGNATIESDGSFYLEVPGDKPLQIELLDRAGKTLKREAGWFWMRRGEQRVCVGCHAGPETAPENSVPKILLKSTIPADLTGATNHLAGGGR